MNTGIGVDIVEIARMEAVLKQTPSFATRVFTEEERRDCEASVRPAAHFASRFAAREAVLKAMGIGFSQGVGRRDVSISHDAKGRPIVVLTGRAREIAQDLGIIEVAVSLSSAGDLAVANAMAITQSSRPAPSSEAEDDAVQVTRSFREARFVLDELEREEQGESAGESERSAAESHGGAHETGFEL